MGISAAKNEKLEMGEKVEKEENVEKICDNAVCAVFS
jgi:hypothetical protein